MLLESFAGDFEFCRRCRERLPHGFGFPAACGNRVSQVLNLSSGSCLAAPKFVGISTVRGSAPGIILLIFLNENLDQFGLTWALTNTRKDALLKSGCRDLSIVAAALVQFVFRAVPAVLPDHAPSFSADAAMPPSRKHMSWTNGSLRRYANDTVLPAFDGFPSCIVDDAQVRHAVSNMLLRLVYEDPGGPR